MWSHEGVRSRAFQHSQNNTKEMAAPSGLARISAIYRTQPAPVVPGPLRILSTLFKCALLSAPPSLRLTIPGRRVFGIVSCGKSSPPYGIRMMSLAPAGRDIRPLPHRVENSAALPSCSVPGRAQSVNHLRLFSFPADVAAFAKQTSSVQSSRIVRRGRATGCTIPWRARPTCS